jgi:RNA polymerase sigma factor (sigma-70 family)
MRSDRELLNEFTRSKSEGAFRTLVERHLDLVHSVARRVTLNDDLARDVCQAVFLKLATRPNDVPGGLKLLAWLHRTSRHKAIDLVRSENRRRLREQNAMQQQMMEMDHEEALDWNELEPVLDGELSKLSASERSLILARYYKRQSHATAAQELGISEDAARMRTRRALEKLRSALARKGIATSGALLASAVSTNAITPAPETLAASISSSSLAAANSGTASSLAALCKAHAATLAILAVSTPIIALQSGEHRQLETQAAEIQSALTALADTETTGSRPPLKVGNRSRHSKLMDLDQILAISDPQSRLGSLLNFAKEIDAWEIPTAITQLRERTAEWNPDARLTAQLLYTRWSKVDGEAALAHVDQLDYQSAGDEISFIVAALAATEPARALAWLENPANKLAHHPTMGQRLAGSVTKEWARLDPAAAIDWALNANHSQRVGAMTGALGTITTTRPEIVDSSLHQWQTQFPSEVAQWKQNNGLQPNN